MRLLGLLLLGFAAAHAQTAPASPAPPASQNIKVDAADWVDTGIDIRAGDVIVISATGTVTDAQGRDAGPDGEPRGFLDLLRAFQVNNAGLGALIGRIGSSDAALPFLVGEAKRLQAPVAGRLFLGMNKSGNDSLTGNFEATVQFLSRGPEKPASLDGLKLPNVTQEIIDRIPRRVVDAQGNLGDNTNFAVAGSEDQVIGAFEAAGWVKVDKTKKEAFLTGLLETLSKQAYVELPMSELMLFGRSQDYGLAHAEPIQVIAQRHHLRLWKAPFKVDGEQLWAGAATHDIGFDRDARNNGVTHKIDPDVDDERDFVGRSLQATGRVAKLDYVMPSKPSKEARTATGATFHSDGRVLVIYLVPENSAASAAR
ncbi:MAG TPA: LssY C-terminal domain-containing protein [Bryobacteraceae bacterium]|nr:LssY C-terminal domain-containing protein [Bryobacteraceae bacterium]